MKLEMKTIERPTLEEAYTKASEHFSCSITDLDIEIAQNPSNGFLGFGKKNAIIVAIKKPIQQQNSDKYQDRKEKYQKSPTVRHEEKRDSAEQSAKETMIAEEATPPTITSPSLSQKNTSSHFDDSIHGIEQNFFDEKLDIFEVCVIVEDEINALFALSCFKLDKISVQVEDEETLLVRFEGSDCALLIGKEGYRYNALSYILFNWINPRYKVGVKLEIAEFLQNQEENIKRYLEQIKSQVYSLGGARTKILDGVLLQIALKELRAEFPNKYVGIKSTDNGAKFIAINDFHSRG
jgi:spoIIIJ-associated protein